MRTAPPCGSGGSLANPDPPRQWRRELDETVTIAMARPIFGESVVLIGTASWGSAFHATAFEPVIGIVQGGTTGLDKRTLG